MAEKAEKKNNKNLVIGICAGVLMLAVIIVAVIFATKSTNLNDAYFVSDNTKYVLTIDGDELSSEDSQYTPAKTHIVYTYSGDNVTGMFTYMEYADAATANLALEAYKSLDQTGVKNLSTNGKYLVVEMTEDQYADVSASDVKQQIEFMEMLKNMDLGEIEDSENTENTENSENAE